MSSDKDKVLEQYHNPTKCLNLGSDDPGVSLFNKLFSDAIAEAQLEIKKHYNRIPSVIKYGNQIIDYITAGNGDIVSTKHCHP